MPNYMVEIRLNRENPQDAARALHTLSAAAARLRRQGLRCGALPSTVRTQDGRLACVVEAPSAGCVRRLLAVALLPPATVREVSSGGGRGITYPLRGTPDR